MDLGTQTGMARQRPHRRTKPRPYGPKPEPRPVGGQPSNWRRSIRAICKDLVTQHSTDIAMQLLTGVTHKSLRTALRYISFVAAYESGKPVETHRMVGLTEGPEGTYDLTKLNRDEQKLLLKLLKKSRDEATSPDPGTSTDLTKPDANIPGSTDAPDQVRTTGKTP